MGIMDKFSAEEQAVLADAAAEALSEEDLVEHLADKHGLDAEDIILLHVTLVEQIEGEDSGAYGDTSTLEDD